MRLVTIILLLLASTLGAADPAAAQNWQRGESRHFVVYSTMSEKDLTQELEDLERIDAGIRHIRGQSDPDVGDGNRVTIFMLDSLKDVQRLLDTDENFAGFYIFRPNGPVAITQRIGGKGAVHEQQTFIHEYAHHLLLQTLRQPAPKWLVEGWAEYFSTAEVRKNGSVHIGRPTQSFAYALERYGQVPLAQLFDQRVEYRDEGIHAFYATSWLLTHYLSFEHARRPQFNRYLEMMSKGTPSHEAAVQAFGGLDGLERELRDYRSRKISFLKIDADQLPTPQVTVTRLDEGDSKAVEAYAEYWLGKGDAARLEELRTLAASHPQSGLLMTTLAMAELSQDNAKEAASAADKAVALRPGSVEPLMLQMRAMLAVAQLVETDGNDRIEMLAQAKDIARRAIALDPRDPEPLRELYHATIKNGQMPDSEAVNAIYKAAVMAPQDFSTRLNAGHILITAGRPDLARQLVSGIAYDPHQPSAAQAARQMIERIDKMAKPSGDR